MQGWTLLAQQLLWNEWPLVFTNTFSNRKKQDLFHRSQWNFLKMYFLLSLTARWYLIACIVVTRLLCSHHSLGWTVLQLVNLARERKNMEALGQQTDSLSEITCLLWADRSYPSSHYDRLHLCFLNVSRHLQDITSSIITVKYSRS